MPHISATRLRLILKDDTKINAAEIENIDGVKGAFATTEQYQIIFGTGIVNKVYDEFSKLIGIAELDSTTSNDIPKKKMNPIARLAKTLSNIFCSNYSSYRRKRFTYGSTRNVESV